MPKNTLIIGKMFVVSINLRTFAIKNKATT